MTFPHPRASLLDPATGVLRQQGRLLRDLAACQAVLLGETHDLAAIHRWQLQLATCLHLLRPDLQMGFEMFPRRVQPVPMLARDCNHPLTTRIGRDGWDSVPEAAREGLTPAA